MKAGVLDLNAPVRLTRWRYGLDGQSLRIQACCHLPGLQRGKLGAFHLIEDAAVASVQRHPRYRKQRPVGGKVHEIAADREDMLARAEFPAAQPAVFA